ncbi:MAG: beta strand repeat-containing protein [Isosphaeraceae bacterium]
MFRTKRSLVDETGRRVPQSVSSRLSRQRRRRATLEWLEDRTLLSPYQVTSTLDSSNPPASGTLRWAVQQANANAGSSIEFELGTGASTITLLSGQLELTKSVTIFDGTGQGPVTISGNNASRVFQIDSGVTASITGVTITGGQTGIYDLGTVNLSDCTITGNNTASSGGGLFVGQPGIHSATAALTNCTISGNSAGNDGGGMYDYGTATFTDCTIAGNSATFGGGLENAGVLKLYDTIVANNTSDRFPSAGDIYGYAPGVSGSYNLIGTGGSGGLVNGTNGNIVGVANPDLGPLGNYGGPTETIPLVVGSQAIGAGSSSISGVTIPSTDQRGLPVDSPPDIGAFQIQHVSPTVTSFAPVTPDPTTSPVSSVAVTLSVPVLPSSWSNAGALTLTDDGGPNLITSAVSVSLDPGTTSTYTISGLSGLTGSTGLYTLTVNAADLQDNLYAVGPGSFSTAWVNGSVPTTLNVPAGSVMALPFSLTVSSLTGSGTLDLNGFTLTVGSTSDLSFTGVIADGSAPGAIVKSGTGTLTLVGANTYSGGTTISAGTLQIGAYDALGTGLVTVSAGAVCSLGSPMTVSELTGSGTVDLNGYALSVNVANNLSPSFSGTIANGAGSAAGSVVKTGPGTQTFSGANTYSGGTTISGGTLQVGSGGSLGSGAVTDNASLVFNRSDTTTVTNSISGSGTLTMEGGGTVTLSGGNTYSGGTTISSGTLQIGAYDALGTGPVTLNDDNTGTSNTALLATVSASDGVGTPIPNNITVANYMGSGTSTLGTTAFNVTPSSSSATVFTGNVILDEAVTFQGGNSDRTEWNGVISSPDGAVNVQVTSASAAGALTVFGGSTNTFAGNISITGSGTMLQASSTPVSVSGFGGSGSGWTVTSNGISSTAITGNTLTLTDGNTSEARSAFYDTRVPTVSSFNASFTYTATSSGFPNNAADGVAFVLQGSAAGASALGGTGGELGVSGIGGPGLAVTFNIFQPNKVGTGFSSTTTGTLTQGTPYQSVSPVVLNNSDPKNINLTYNAAAETITETLTDLVTGATNVGSPIIIPNVNLAALFGGNTAYVGFTGASGGATATQKISNFSFQTEPGSALSGSDNVQVGAGATLGFQSGSLIINGLSGSDSGTVESLSSAGGVLDVGVGGGNGSFSGAIGGSSPNPLELAKYGTGIQTISGADTYTLGTDIYAGTLQLGSGTALGSPAGGVLIDSGGTLDLDGQAISTTLYMAGTGAGGNGALINSSTITTASDSGDIDEEPGSAFSVGGAGNLNLSGSVNATGGAFTLTMAGTGTLTLSGSTNNAELGLVVDSGTVILA